MIKYKNKPKKLTKKIQCHRVKEILNKYFLRWGNYNKSALDRSEN